jgi:hypothetical protein
MTAWSITCKNIEKLPKIVQAVTGVTDELIDVDKCPLQRLVIHIVYLKGVTILLPLTTTLVVISH